MVNLEKSVNQLITAYVKKLASYRKSNQAFTYQKQQMVADAHRIFKTITTLTTKKDFSLSELEDLLLKLQNIWFVGNKKLQQLINKNKQPTLTSNVDNRKFQQDTPFRPPPFLFRSSNPYENLDLPLMEIYHLVYNAREEKLNMSQHFNDTALTEYADYSKQRITTKYPGYNLDHLLKGMQNKVIPEAIRDFNRDTTLEGKLIRSTLPTPSNQTDSNKQDITNEIIRSIINFAGKGNGKKAVFILDQGGQVLATTILHYLQQTTTSNKNEGYMPIASNTMINWGKDGNGDIVCDIFYSAQTLIFPDRKIKRKLDVAYKLGSNGKLEAASNKEASAISITPENHPPILNLNYRIKLVENAQGEIIPKLDNYELKINTKDIKLKSDSDPEKVDILGHGLKLVLISAVFYESYIML